MQDSITFCKTLSEKEIDLKIERFERADDEQDTDDEDDSKVTCKRLFLEDC
jgi:hypothetical protein